MSQVPNAKPVVVGHRSGRLVVIGEAPSYIQPSGQPVRCVLCHCDCGTDKIVKAHAIRSGSTMSCGCLRYETNFRVLKHGGTRTAEYAAWCAMIGRCENPNNNRYDRYGARGITVCRRWRHGEEGKSGFECFLADMGPRPSPAYSLDRHPNNDGNYERNNVRWATDVEQTRNRHTTRMVIYQGRAMPLAEACELTSLKPATVKFRLNSGMSIEDALSAPLRPNGSAPTSDQSEMRSKT